MRIKSVFVASTIFTLMFAGSAMAQQRHIADITVIRQAVAGQALIDQQNRDVVVGVLRTTQASEIAARLGLQVSTAQSAVSTLSSTDLAKAAVQARAIDAQLSGGSNNTVVISTTTLLLILIIVLLVA